MPSSVPLFDGTVLCARRCAGSGENGIWHTWIDLYGSGDQGRSWQLRATPVPDVGPATVRTDDIAVRDMGYPRAVVMNDRTVLAVYYANSAARSERYIEAVRWQP